jgi:hypothetical protein
MTSEPLSDRRYRGAPRTLTSTARSSVEHNRIGLFQPLTITQSVERGEPWTPAELCEALGKLELHALADAYS